MGSDHRFQHEMHHQGSHCRLVDRWHTKNPGRSAVICQRLRRSSARNGEKIAYRPPPEIGQALNIGHRVRQVWSLSRSIGQDQCVHLVGGSIEIKLYLAVLVDGADGPDWCRSLS